MPWPLPLSASFRDAPRPSNLVQPRNDRFQDVYASSQVPESSSLFASRNPEGKKMIAIALNLDPDRPSKPTWS